MIKLLTAFAADQSGATAVEYAFFAGLVSIASVLAWDALGATLEAAFRSMAADVDQLTKG